MTADQMAHIHAAAFVQERGWTADEFTQLLGQKFVHPFTTEGGFALTRTLAGESELLTLAVSPLFQRRGIARSLLATWLAAVRSEADVAFLEVAADNHAAIALYHSAGFTRNGLRKAYYTRNDAPAVDAVLMSHALTQG